MSASLENIQTIDGGKGRIRIERQRAGYDRLAAAIAKAGFKQSAREFRAEAERAIARAEEFEKERTYFARCEIELTEIRSALNTYAPTTSEDGHTMTEPERVEWVIRQWKTASLELTAIAKGAVHG